MDVAISTRDLHAEGLLVENTLAEMTPIARLWNAKRVMIEVIGVKFNTALVAVNLWSDCSKGSKRFSGNLTVTSLGVIIMSVLAGLVPDAKISFPVWPLAYCSEENVWYTHVVLAGGGGHVSERECVCLAEMDTHDIAPRLTWFFSLIK